ncbi:hypothetical protein [Brevibacillus laterosporus]|nr:hypothetical protein [Brevibacillus laterosporus]
MNENKKKAVSKVTAENKLITWGDLESAGITWKEAEASNFIFE